MKRGVVKDGRVAAFLSEDGVINWALLLAYM